MRGVAGEQMGRGGECYYEVYEAWSRKRIGKIDRELSEISSKAGANLPVIQKVEETQCLTLRLGFEGVAGVVFRSSAVLL
jgi:hypothetical protein